MTEIQAIPGFARVALKVRTGSQESAILYTKKGDQTHAEWEQHHEHGPTFGNNVDWVEYGTPSKVKQGTRTDVTALMADVKSLKTDLELVDNHGELALRYFKAIQTLRQQIKPAKGQPTEIYLMVGPTGVGKTRKAYQDWPDLWEVPISQGTSNWFDGYAGQKVVLFDEFSGDMPLRNALKILDHWYVRQVPTKGGHVWFNPSVVLVTSNFHPSTWYDYSSRIEHERALRRRFHRVYHGADLTLLDTTEAIDAWWPIKGDKPTIQQNIDNNYLTDQEVNRQLIQ